MYYPSVHAEQLLVNVIIPGVLRGLAKRDFRDYRILYSNVKITKSSYKSLRVWNVHVDANIFKVNSAGVQEHDRTCTNVWIAALPRLEDSGLLKIGSLYYHTVMRQRMVPNVPIVVRKSSGIVCMLRSENLETLESSSYRMHRKHNKTMVLDSGAKGSIAIDVTGYFKHHISRQDWLHVLKQLLSMLGASTTVTVQVELLSYITGEAQSVAYILPSTITYSGQHYYTNICDCDISTECVLICYMLLRYLSVECGESQADDIDDYSNRVVDDYAVIMGKLFRKIVMKCGVNIVNISSADSPKLHDKFVDAFTYNKWEIVEKYESKLQISRIVEHTSPNCIAAALQEVIILSGVHNYSDNLEETYNVRMIHPSQHGFVCLIRTSDDVSAGMKLYLASDCRISHELYTFATSFEDDNLRLRQTLKQLQVDSTHRQTYQELLQTNSQQTLRIWLHNGHIVGIVDVTRATLFLEQAKTNRHSISFNIGNIIESRDYYGRFMCRVQTTTGETLVDAREMPRVLNSIVTKASNFSILCHEVPYINMMPVARTMLATKIMQKTISAHPPAHNDIEYSQLLYAQLPLVCTSKSSSYCYGYNALVCYATYRALGIEDGIILNKASVERGLFMIIKKSTMSWYKNKKWTVSEYIINAKINTEVKEGAILAIVTYTSEDGIVSVGKIKHTKPYVCRVSNIELEFDTGASKTYGLIAPKYLTEITITLTRCKRFRTGDKLSSRSAQKAVCVKVLEEADMPLIVSSSLLPHTVDMIINPLSVISRCTISQDLASTLGIIAADVGASFVDYPFAHTEICYGNSSRKHFDTTNLQNVRATIVDGCTGEICEQDVTIGIEYYMVLNHIADTKTKSHTSINKDRNVAAIGKRDAEGSVRYNWQELAAMIHAKSDTLLSSIYNNTGDLGIYPYCVACDKDVDADANNCCEYCGASISSCVRMSRSFAAARRIFQVLGANASISCNALF